jgi:hypothetical protein
MRAVVLAAAQQLLVRAGGDDRRAACREVAPVLDREAVRQDVDVE